jgi:sporulation protein YlmC with PRC-barrel domain
MRFSDKELRGLPVVTKSGDKIGKLIGFVIDGDNHAVVQYVVAKSRLLSAFLPKELLIHPAQVISIDEEKMVVKGDLVALETAEAVAFSGSRAGTVSNMNRSTRS